jgi:hypothetical protein
MPQHYDPSVIQKFADDLYAQAATTMAVYALVGCVAGGAIGYELLAVASAESASTGAIIGLVIGGLLGFATGTRIGFGLKLQAQVALCQVRIEENTRPARDLATDQDAKLNRGDSSIPSFKPL